MYPALHALPVARHYLRGVGVFHRKSSVPSLDELAEDNAALTKVQVEFPALRKASADGSPTSVLALLDYLANEVPNGSQLSESNHLRRPNEGEADAEYWLWRFREPGPEGQDAFVTVSRRGGQVCVGYEADYYGLTPEQYILGDYHQVF